MRPNKLLLLSLLGCAPAMMAQSAIDAYNVSSTDLYGTARFQSMAGAFTALGGDISTMNQNPAGIGVYRSNDFNLSFDVGMQSAKTNAYGNKTTLDKTFADFTNIGYVGAFSINNEVMPYLSFGVSYNRIASFNRRYSGYFNSINTSLSNYIAGISNGIAPEDLLFDNKSSYNPYFDSDCDWLSILSYNGYLINPVGNSDQYNGLYQNGTIADAQFEVWEKGHIDEYAFNLGGNIMNTVYWGVGVGITDLSYRSKVFYGESLGGALIPDQSGNNTMTGAAYYRLDNEKSISGTGFNFKFGVIVKPINELRFGAAIHTPTWYKLNHQYYGDLYSQFAVNADDQPFLTSEQGTPMADFEWRLRSPWRFTLGAAGVIGGRGIISVDYERVQYNNMSISTPNSWGDSFQPNDYLNGDIKNYFQAANIVRIGAEFRATPWLSLRAGYSYQSSDVKEAAYDGYEEVFTSGTDPSFTFDNTTQYITAGVGLRYKSFYLDMAYVHKRQESEYHAFTNYGNVVSPKASLTNNNNKLVFTLGYKF